MPTRDTITAYVQENLEDSSSTFFTQDAINDSLQDGYNLIVAVTGCIPKSATISLQSEAYYDLPSLISDFQYLVAIWYPDQRRWLTPISRRQVSLLRHDYELWNGSPNFFSPISFQKALIVPWLTSPTGTLKVFYRAKADTLTGSSVPLIPNEQNSILELYSTADMLELGREFTKAQTYWGDYKYKLDQINKSVYGLGQAAKIMVMQPFNDMPIYPHA